MDIRTDFPYILQDIVPFGSAAQKESIHSLSGLSLSQPLKGLHQPLRGLIQPWLAPETPGLASDFLGLMKDLSWPLRGLG